MPIEKLSATLREPLTEVVAIHCSDYRFIEGYREFLNINLGLDGNYDLIAIPGGPQSLTGVDHLPNFNWASVKWARFLIEAHALKRLILFQHQDCAWYRTVPAHLHASPEPRLRQEEDLRRVLTAVARDFPHLTVESYYVGSDASKQIVVEKVEV